MDEPAPATLAPVAPDRRVALVDALRAIALLGILLVNVSYYAHPFELRMLGHGPDQHAIDAAATALVRFFAEGKFYTLFSLLFGFGLAIQMSNAEERGLPDRFRGRWRRRLLVLLGIGVLHGALVWAGDVLTGYALLGFLALRLARTAPRRLVGWAIGLNLATVLFFAGFAALLLWVAADQHGQSETEADAARAYQIYASGTFAEITRERLADYGWNVASWVLVMPAALLGNFAFGIWVARRGLLADPAAHRRLLRRMFVGGLVVGLPANAAHLAVGRFLDGTPGMPESDLAPMSLGLATMLVGGAAFCLSYLSGVALLWLRASPRRWLLAIAPAGRMALTNYLLQSLICTTIFYGYGLGRFGKLGAAAAVALALVIWCGQVLLSRWWLARHAFGPGEWLWRSLTYGARQPMRLRGAPPPP